ncbi:Rpn family recombination-promoting nuclease/putative transposase [Ruania alkalisoli]|uniref:Rpn family recombination-promoting nuclease/putative transposase n=1 Tax=Ruania alkalisoli TaxID=2779775 RepID=A0A7M1SQF8_9MICO|nr:Rpn family recombination-promoting nuclease/putative transposase [Ruania alkalisoli]QOR69397.1 Rpn family recombination-promoting nuclease/putative transposase [Ruania alkalisoli]
MCPHDAMFRAVVGVPANAASVLTSVLPAHITGSLDLDGLRLEPGSFVDEEMRQRHTDLLFSTRLNGDPALVYVLVEHQSSPDPLMALRVLDYVTRIWWRHLDVGAESDDPHQPRRTGPGAAARTLPPVLPVVVYQGRRRWNTPTAMDGLYDAASEQALGSFLPRHQFVLQDLTGVEVEELLAAPLTPAARLALAMLRFAPRQEHLAQVLEQFTPDVLDLVRTRADRMFTIIMEYAYQVSDSPPAQVRRYFEDLGPDAREAYMSNTLERGRAEGVAEGVAKGRAEQGARMMTRLLVQKFGPLTSEQTARIESATPDQLEAWVDHLDEATTIDDVLR